MTGPVFDATGVLVASPGAAARRAEPTIVQLARRKPWAIGALVFLVLLVAIAVLGPVIAPYDPIEGDLAASLQGPSWQHLLGTDQLGRDTFSRLLVGTGPTFLLTGLVVLAALVTGVTLGMIAGFAGGRTDAAIMSLGDLLVSLPGMVMLLVILTVFQDQVPVAMILIGILISGFLMRVIRASTLSYRQETFIEAARVAGLPTSLIIARHILSRQFGTVLVQASLLTGMALLLVTGVAYLGFGTQPPYPSWGLMLGDGAQIFGSQPTLMLTAGVAIALTVTATALLGEGLRDVTVEKWGGRREQQRPTRRAPRRARIVDAEMAAVVRSGVVGGDDGALLTVRDLEISYGPVGDANAVVHGIGLEVAAGETVGLLGESGSGKSATARAILGILRGGHISGGSVSFDGHDITGIARFDAAERASLRIGYIAQEPHLSLDPSWKVGAQLMECLRRHDPSMSRRDAAKRAVELLARVRMSDPEQTFRQYPFQLSGGMAQRVAIARALCGEPRLLIADEPTTALDVTVQAEILDLLRDIQGRTGMAILLITHDWGVVADVCDRAVVMRYGVIRETADVESLFAHPEDSYSASLLAASPATMPSRAARVPRPISGRATS